MPVHFLSKFRRKIQGIYIPWNHSGVRKLWLTFNEQNRLSPKWQLTWPDMTKWLPLVALWRMSSIHSFLHLILCFSSSGKQLPKPQVVLKNPPRWLIHSLHCTNHLGSLVNYSFSLETALISLQHIFDCFQYHTHQNCLSVSNNNTFTSVKQVQVRYFEGGRKVLLFGTLLFGDAFKK